MLCFCSISQTIHAFDQIAGRSRDVKKGEVVDLFSCFNRVLQSVTLVSLSLISKLPFALHGSVR